MGTFDRPPGSPLDHALTLRESGDIEGAITFLFKAVGESLNDRGLVITLAKMLSETGKFERAEHWFRHALKIAPDVSMRFGTPEDETHGDRSDRSGEPSRPFRGSGAVARADVCY